MYWQWHRNEPSRLAAFANPHILRTVFDVPYSRFREQRTHSHFRNYARAKLEEIYSKLSAHKIIYEGDPPNPGDPEVQKIRMPRTIRKENEGTCLDLALLFASCCLASDLIPVVIVSPTERDATHAFLAVSLKYGLRECLDGDRALFGELSSTSLFVSAEKWVEVDREDYLLIDCIGVTVENREQKNPNLSFRDAVQRGSELIAQVDPRYCVDCAIMQYGKRVLLDPVDGQTFPQIDELLQHWKRWADSHRFSLPIELLPDVPNVEPPLSPACHDFLDAPDWGTTLKVLVDDLWLRLTGQSPYPVLNECAKIAAKHHSINWKQDYDSIVRKLKGPIRDIFVLLLDERNRLQSENGSYQMVGTFNSLLNLASSIKSQLDAVHYDKCMLISGSFGSGKRFLCDQILEEIAGSGGEKRLLVIQPQLASTDDLGEAITSFINEELGVSCTLRGLDDVLLFNGFRIIVVLESLQEYFRNHSKSVRAAMQFLQRSTQYRSIRYMVSINFNGYDQISRFAPVWKQLASEESSEWQHGGWYLLDRINISERLGLRILEQEMPEVADNIDRINDVLKNQLCSPLLAKLAVSFGIQENNILNFNYIEFFDAFRRSLNEIDVQPFAMADVEHNIALLARFVGATGKLQISRTELLEVLDVDRSQQNELIDCLQRMSVLYVTRKTRSTYQVQLSFELFWAFWIADGAVEELLGKSREEQLAILTQQANNLAHAGLCELVIEMTLLLLDEREFVPGLWGEILNSKFPAKSAVFFAAVKANPERQSEIVEFVKAVRQGRSSVDGERDFFAMLHFIAENPLVPIQQFIEVCRGRDADNPFKYILPREPEEHNLEDYFYFVFQDKLWTTSDLRAVFGAICQLSSSHYLGFPLQMAEDIWDKIIEIESDDQVINQLIQRYLESDSRIFELEGSLNEKWLAKRNQSRPQGGKPVYFREYLIDKYFDWAIERSGAASFETFKQLDWFSKPKQPDVSGFPAGLQRELRKRWSLSSGEFYRRSATSRQREEYANFVDSLSESEEDLDWRIAWYMIRHTTRITRGVAYVDDVFRDAIDRINAKPEAQVIVERNRIELASKRYRG